MMSQKVKEAAALGFAFAPRPGEARVTGRGWRTGIWLVLLLAGGLALPILAVAQAATAGPNTIVNGTSSGITTPGFLFEPEVPFASLKTVPIWNELEQLLDNPYRVGLCSTLPATVPALVRNTPGNEQGFPSYCTLVTGPTALQRRPGFGVTLPPLLTDPLNYNPTTGEEMRLLNPDYQGGTFRVPDELVQCVPQNAPLPAGCPATPDPNRWVWRYRTVQVSPGASRVLEGAAIDYNAPMRADAFTCITTTEVVPPEGSILCGGDPGEPGYVGLGLPVGQGIGYQAAYSTPAVPGVLSAGQAISSGHRLFDPSRGIIQPRNPATGAGGLDKPSLRIPVAGGTPSNPNYLVNVNPDSVLPSNENDYVRNRAAATVLGKALFWDMQVGSDGVQSCGTCHFNGTGTDTRTRNQINPNHLGGDATFQLMQPNERDLVASDFPLHKLRNPEIAGDPACVPAMTASVNAGVLENNFPGGVSNAVVCDAANVAADVNDVVSSMGVHWGVFADIAPIGVLIPATGPTGVAVVGPDVRAPVVPGTITADPIAGFAGATGNEFRRVEPRNTPTMQAAAFNFDNFWDGRARHDFNGGSVFGAADPQPHIWTPDATGTLVPTRQIIRFASIASLATGPGLSEFEMSFLGRNWAKVGKKLLQAGVTPLANQQVSATDSVLGPYSNQGGGSTACTSLPVADRSASWSGTNVPGKPGLCISYPGLIRQAYYPGLWQSTGEHLVGCYTDTDPALIAIRPNQCAPGTVAVPVLDGGTVVAGEKDPFDSYVLSRAAGTALPTDTNQFTQMEGNFSLFWGLSVDLWVGILVPDDTPFDQFLDANPDAFRALGEPGEPGLVPGLLNCASPTQRDCFREVGNFKRDPGVRATINATGEGNAGAVTVAAGGTRAPGTTDPLLGMDIFFASNLSLKNPNFRTARCGECHAVPTLTDHTVAFTSKVNLRDFVAEFVPGQPGNETIIEPLGRLRTISGFLLESELAENGQDAVERRIANQSIVPCPTDGLAYPGGSEPVLAAGPGFGPCGGSAAAFFDNGVYNLGVRPIAEDAGRGGTDAFGWPLSLAALMLKNLGGVGFEPGHELPNFDPTDPSGGGGLFEETAQDQQINPGIEGDPIAPQLPAYLAPWANQINVGDSMPELDEVFGGLNTLTDIGMLEGFLDTLGPFNPAGILNESLNMAEGTLMGTWPVVNRVGRDGSFKAPQLRNVELTGPYFHNGGKLTLRQVIDFYVRGGDFPMTNAAHRDFNMVNMNLEVQSNLTEEEKVALVDFLLELTDERNRFDRAPFDHPQVIVPVDGRAPENVAGRATLLADPMFRDVPAVGAAGQATPEPTFLGIAGRSPGLNGQPIQRLVGAAANCGPSATSHYCH